MFRLTWRSLLARKARLAMSTVAIVLGIGFLGGVLTFSSGLSTTFTGIIEGSTSDALVRPAGTASFEAVGAGSTATVSPDEVAALDALPEVARADGSVDGLGLYVLDPDDKLVGTGGAPTLAFNYAASPNMAGEPILELDGGRWPEADDEVALDTAAAENAGYELGDRVTVIPPGIDGSGPITRELELVGLAGFNGGAGTAGSTLVIFSTDGAQAMFLGGADVFTSVTLTAADGVTQAELVEAAGAALPAGYEAVTGDEVAEESQSAGGEVLGFIDIFLGTFAVIAVIVGGFIIAEVIARLSKRKSRLPTTVYAVNAVQEEIGRVTNGVGWCYHDTSPFLVKTATPWQMERYVQPILEGKRHECYAITEEGAGSDVDAIQATARKQGNGYLLSGLKWHVTSANLADVIIFQAKLEDGSHGLFYVDSDAAGIETVRTPAYSHTYPAHHPIMQFTDVKVPADALIDPEGSGIALTHEWFRQERLGIAGRCCGAASRLIDEALAFAEQRVQFGRPIIENQAIAFMLADSLTELWAGRLMIHRLAQSIDAGEDVKVQHAQCAMAKLYCSEMANRVADRAVQIFGGRGYMREYAAERFYRELRVDRIWEGTSEIQRMIIAHSLARRGQDALIG